MRSRRAKRREDGRCAHAYVRPVYATTEATSERGTAVVICVHCAAFWVAGRLGWKDAGALKGNLAAQAPHRFRNGYQMQVLSDAAIVGDFSNAIRIAEQAAGIWKESTGVP